MEEVLVVFLLVQEVMVVQVDQVVVDKVIHLKFYLTQEQETLLQQLPLKETLVVVEDFLDLLHVLKLVVVAVVLVLQELLLINQALVLVMVVLVELD